ncbi:MAG: SDR family oxidoreductase [Candidatus Sericytochromatia bacterium]
MARLLLAGASGQLGQAVLTQAHSLPQESRHWIRTLSRSRPKTEGDQVFLADATQAESLKGVCEDIDVLVSCLGASVGMKAQERRNYKEVDLVAHRHLLNEAQQAGVKRLVYVSLWTESAYLDNGYVAAHEAVVALLKQSGIPLTVMRPTGFFSAMAEFFELARKGLAPLPGGGHCRSNPIHEADLASALLGYLEQGPAEVGLGGPEVFSRKQIFELAFAALGKTPKFLPLPLAVMTGMASLAGFIDPRMGDLMRFAAQVSSTDCIAPAVGSQKLRDYFAALARD